MSLNLKNLKHLVSGETIGTYTEDCKCELDGFQGAMTSQNCSIHIQPTKDPHEKLHEAIHRNNARLARRKQLLDSEAEAEWGQMFAPPPTLTPTEKGDMWEKIISVINIKRYLP